MGFEVNESGYLNTTTKFGCQTNWVELNRYCRHLKIKIQWEEGVAHVKIGGDTLNPRTLQKKLYDHVINNICIHSSELKLQGLFLNMKNIDDKISNTLHYNWNVNDQLVIFLVKARLSILPTNYTKYIWNRETNPKCPFCKIKNENMAHLLNGCSVAFNNFYSRRHNRINDKLHAEMKMTLSYNCEIFNNKCVDTTLPELKEEICKIKHRKPDIFLINKIEKICEIIEITICFDQYLEFAYESKKEVYQPLKAYLEANGFTVTLTILCFGSLGSIKKDCFKNLKRFVNDTARVKSILKWCSISNVIGANYIWRSRLKRLQGVIV